MKRNASLKRARPPFTRKPCRKCGAEFRPRSPKHYYCSAECRLGDLPIRECEHCGRQFRAEAWKVQRFCSLSCSQKVVVRAVCDLAPRKCRACGKVFQPPTRSDRYCSWPCRHEMRKKRERIKARGGSPNGWGLKAKGDRACRNCGAEASHLHHIIPRSKSRRGREEVHLNGLPLCFKCHRGWHDRCISICHSILTDDEFAFAVTLVGGLWVERNYPDEILVAYHRLDEMRRGHRIAHGLAEAFDERLERITNEGRLVACQGAV